MKAMIFRDWQHGRALSDEGAASFFGLPPERWAYVRENPHRIPVWELRLLMQKAFPDEEELEDAMEKCFTLAALPLDAEGSVHPLEDEISVYELKKHGPDRAQRGPAS